MKSFVPGTHAATFGGNPLACSTALSAFKVYTKAGFLEKAQQTGGYFISRLRELEKSFPVVKEVRGVGLLLAMELKQPAGTIVNDCMRAGYLINCIKQNILRFIPPLIVTKKEIDGLIGVLFQSLISVCRVSFPSASVMTVYLIDLMARVAYSGTPGATLTWPVAGSIS